MVKECPVELEPPSQVLEIWEKLLWKKVEKKPADSTPDPILLFRMDTILFLFRQENSLYLSIQESSVILMLS